MVYFVSAFPKLIFSPLVSRYDPRRVTTANGSLVVTLDQADPDTNHNLNVSLIPSSAIDSVLTSVS